MNARSFKALPALPAEPGAWEWLCRTGKPRLLRASTAPPAEPSEALTTYTPENYLGVPAYYVYPASGSRPPQSWDKGLLSSPVLSSLEASKVLLPLAGSLEHLGRPTAGYLCVTDCCVLSSACPPLTMSLVPLRPKILSLPDCQCKVPVVSSPWCCSGAQPCTRHHSQTAACDSGESAK